VTDEGLFSPRTRRVLVGGSLVVVLLLVVFAGVRALTSGSSTPSVAQGQVRLGPESGERVADYLARLPSTLPAPGSRALALVQFSAALTTPDAAAAATLAVPVSEAVFRFPIPRVQTALRFEAIPASAPLAAALDTARQRAGYAAEADAARLAASASGVTGSGGAGSGGAGSGGGAGGMSTGGAGSADTGPGGAGRPAAVARAEAAGYAQPCTCVIALVVEGDRAALERLAATPGVRAVEAAPVGVTAPELALAPLLPEQTDTASPLPDDGPL
jgi:hypothetical protein